jgi:hypothetical protein
MPFRAIGPDGMLDGIRSVRDTTAEQSDHVIANPPWMERN